MTREQMIERMIDCDIADIRQAMFEDDHNFLYAVLSGEGWIPYNQLSDNAIEQTYLAYEFDEEQNDD
jgi:hypothetical protein